jgi:hypothetical protein
MAEDEEGRQANSSGGLRRTYGPWIRRRKLVPWPRRAKDCTPHNTELHRLDFVDGSHDLEKIMT